MSQPGVSGSQKASSSYSVMEATSALTFSGRIEFTLGSKLVRKKNIVESQDKVHRTTAPSWLWWLVPVISIPEKEMKIIGSGVQGQPWLHNVFKDSLGCMRNCLKNKAK